MTPWQRLLSPLNNTTGPREKKVPRTLSGALRRLFVGSDGVAAQVISELSQQQKSSIHQAKAGFDQISSVVQTSSATAEESAAASEELSGQAELLREQAAKFRLHTEEL